MIKLKDMLNVDITLGKVYTDKDRPPFQVKEESITEAKKSDVKKMEKMADKIVADMTKLNFMFRKHHMTKTSNPVAYRTLKDWEELQRDANGKYGGWFEYVYDSDNVE